MGGGAGLAVCLAERVWQATHVYGVSLLLLLLLLLPPLQALLSHSVPVLAVLARGSCQAAGRVI